MADRRGMNRLLLVSIVSLFAITFFASVVVAGPQELINDLSNWIGPDATGEGTMLFTRLLLMSLVALVVYAVMPRSFKSVAWAISIIVAILSFLFISPENIRYILINYEALGVAITTIIPLMIFVAAIVKLSMDHPVAGAIVRYFGSAVFVLYILGSWIANYGEEGFIGGSLAYIYPLSLIVAVVVFIWGGRIMRRVQRLREEGRDEAMRRGTGNIRRGMEAAATMGRVAQSDDLGGPG